MFNRYHLYFIYTQERIKKKICFPTILSICSVTLNSNIHTPLLSLTLFCVFILIVIRTTCHIFTIYYQIQRFNALVLTQRIVQHNTYMLLPSPLPQISHAFSFCCSQPKESRIFSAIQTMWTRQWLFWGKSQVHLAQDSVTDSHQRQWPKEKSHVRTALEYYSHSPGTLFWLPAICGSKTWI